MPYALYLHDIHCIGRTSRAHVIQVSMLLDRDLHCKPEQQDMRAHVQNVFKRKVSEVNLFQIHYPCSGARIKPYLPLYEYRGYDKQVKLVCFVSRDCLVP